MTQIIIPSCGGCCGCPESSKTLQVVWSGIIFCDGFGFCFELGATHSGSIDVLGETFPLQNPFNLPPATGGGWATTAGIGSIISSAEYSGLVCSGGQVGNVNGTATAFISCGDGGVKLRILLPVVGTVGGDDTATLIIFSGSGAIGSPIMNDLTACNQVLDGDEAFGHDGTATVSVL